MQTFASVWAIVTVVFSGSMGTAIVLLGALTLRTPVNFFYSGCGLNPFEIELSTIAQIGTLVIAFLYARLSV